MPISAGRTILIILVCAACTFAERALPFLVFRGRAVPPVVHYLGKVLPAAVIATLLVYCLRGMDFSAAAGFAPQLIGVAITAGLHFWKHNTLISIAGGTICYMALLQTVFA